MSARDDYPLVFRDAAHGAFNDRAAEATRALDEIDRLRAEVARVRAYAEAMDALCEERLIGWNRERVLADRLAAEVAHFIDGGTPDVSTVAAFNDWREARQ